MANELEVGQIAPDFKLPTDGDGEFALKLRKGHAIVLYFYPKDDTSGCTKQAIAFSEMLDEFSALGAEIVGVSADSVAKHDKFKSKHDLKVTLVSDEQRDIIERYGVWIEKSMYGRKYMGIERATFLIDKDGKIARIWRKVKVPGHAGEVLDAVKQLS